MSAARAAYVNDNVRLWARVALALLLAGVARPALGQPGGQEGSAASPGTVPSRPGTVAVAPFTNLSGHAGDAWLGAGIAETVATDLEQLSSLTVVSGEVSNHPFRGPAGVATGPPPGLAAARESGVAWLVTGGFERLGPEIRITARIVGVDTGAVRRIVRVEGALDDLFGLQDRVAAQLRDGFAGVAGASVAVRPPAAPAPPASAALAAPVAAPPADGDGDGVGPLTPPRRRRGGVFGAASAPPEAAVAEVAAPPGRPAEPEPFPDDAPRAFLPGSLPPLPPAPFVPGDPASRIPDGMAAGDNEPRFGVAAGAGILTGRPLVRPPRASAPPSIDGRLDDAAWARAAHITDLVQLAPRAGEPASETSDVYITYDSANIYIAFHAHFSDPQTMRAQRKDRDVRTGDDVFWVYFDPFLDQQRAYSFGVNAYGVQMDTIVSSRSGGGFGRRRGGGGPGLRLPFGDASWDTLFDSAGRIVADGFTAEIAIPFKSLRYPQRGGNAPHQWGFQIARRIRGNNETAVWAPVNREIAGFLPQMGVLQGMTGLSTSRNIEILPTFTAVQLGALDDAGSFDNGEARPEGGVNFKYGVTSNLTADVTYNPDFSQIESDRPQIEQNQRFALFYPELRPFFLEGAEIFDIPAPARVVHTRTIVDPRYGAKLTGKTGNTTVGVMYANDEAPGNVDDTGASAFGHSAQTFVGRVRYDLYAESFVGATYTDREFLDSHNRVAGLDSRFRLGDTHELGMLAFGTQHRDLDGLETSGHMVNANIRKTGRNLRYLLAWYSLSPDFKTDVGFVRRTDQRFGYSEIAYRWWPESWIISWGPRVRYTRSYNFDGILEDEQASAGLNVAFADSINANGEVNRDMERFGGIDFFKTRYRFFSAVSKIRQFSFGVGGTGGDQIFFDEERPYLGRDSGWNVFLNLRPIPRLESRINVDTNRFVDVGSNDLLVFDVNIFRTLTTYQFTDRFLLRNISEYNSFDQKLSLNFLFTYRVNAGTAFYVGYDDRYQQADHIVRDLDGNGIDDRFFQSTALRRTNRAFFTKLQYLFRY